MNLFKSKEEKRLDSIIRSMEMNMSNNYKDNAQDDFRDLDKTFEEYKSENRLKDKIVTKYEKIIEEYRKHLKGYTHKDQKPFRILLSPLKMTKDLFDDVGSWFS